ncbi:MAG: hypothetical protein HBSAPP03_19000 [Phycisphaerae bacterium]|nr:MAG: hypothetical protein HBSAPP03_19000 [Phycisphaerae bacterium]
MAKGQYLSAYQQGIVKRFYEHRDTVLWQRLAELVSEIYLAESEKAAAKLWASAGDTLRKVGVEQKVIDAIVTERRVADLAGVVNALSARPPRSPGRSAKPSDDDTFGG